MTLTAGTTLGPYRIEAPIGAGGMGEVYRARDTRLDRTVAIKVLPAHLAGQPDLRARLEREARAISSLNHPHICTLFDVGHQDGTDFLVMEFLEGETVAQRLARGPIPPDEVVRHGIAIADALDKAHRQGLVHRDLKPGNVMLTRSGVKLLDFGLAKVALPPGAGPDSLTSLPTEAAGGQPLTSEGSLVGTFQYMAPEQLEGGEADARTDVFALGALLYEMVTGRPAFQGKSRASLISAIMASQPPPIASLQPLASPALERVVRTCMAKDPDDRVQTAHDVGLQLQWIAEGGSEAGIPAPVIARRRGRMRLAWGLAAVFALTTAGALAVLVLRRPPPPAAVRFQITQSGAMQGMEWPRISPDGRLLAFQAADTTGQRTIWVRPLDALDARPLPGTENAGRPFWSPDSRYLAYFTGTQLKKVAVAGGPPQLVAEAPRGADGSWGSRDVILFDGGAGDSIRQVSAAGGIPAGAATRDRSAGDTGLGWPCFLPDGRHFLYVASRPGQGTQNSVLKLGTLGSARSRDLGRVGSRVELDPSGRVLYCTQGTLMARRFDLRSFTLEGEPYPVAEHVSNDPSGRADFSVSGTGTLAYALGGQTAMSRLVWVDRAGNELGTVGPPDTYRDPAISPDGTRVAYGLVDPKTGSQDLWVRDLSRDVASRLTFDPGNELWSTWSPDGRRIAYACDALGPFDVLARAADGTGEVDTLHVAKTAAGPTDWSRDGSTVFYNDYDQGSVGLSSVSAADSRAVREVLATPFNERGACLSPDGRWLAYDSNESGEYQVYVRAYPGPGGRWQVSTRGGREAEWRADGRELYYRDPSGYLEAVEVRASGSFSIGSPVRLFRRRLSGGSILRNRYAVSADGKRFLLVVPASQEGPRSSFTVVLDWAADFAKR